MGTFGLHIVCISRTILQHRVVGFGNILNHFKVVLAL